MAARHVLEFCPVRMAETNHVHAYHRTSLGHLCKLHLLRGIGMPFNMAQWLCNSILAQMVMYGEEPLIFKSTEEVSYKSGSWVQRLPNTVVSTSYLTCCSALSPDKPCCQSGGVCHWPDLKQKINTCGKVSQARCLLAMKMCTRN